MVEKLTDVPYISNDCNLKDGTNGILLYGVNGVGKSVFLKSIGLNIVLAQSGNVTGSASTILGLVTLFFALGIMIAGVNIAVGGLQDVGLI